MKPFRLLATLLSSAAFAAVLHSQRLSSGAKQAYRPDRILVQPRPQISPAALADFHTTQTTDVLQVFERIGRLQVLRVPEGQTVEDLVGAYQRSDLVEFAEPDYIGTVFAAPDDPKYLDGTLWGLTNTGQNEGTPGADIAAATGWDLQCLASNVVVAVIDTGVRYTHEDLAANMWMDPADGSHGTNALAGTNDPNDDSGHGTMVAGVLGAVGNNGKGVVGVAWQVRIMACKAFDNLGIGSVSSAVACLDYATAHGARIVNASWGFTNSLALSNALDHARSSGVIVVAAAGNSGVDIDADPSYPACYPLDNIVTVASTTRRDELGGTSNYGVTRVDLAAPGEQIHSTFGATDSFYFSNTGSSFAAAYVSGALALALAKYPTETPQQLVARVLTATDPLTSLEGKCVTGGRLNLRKALSPPSIQLVVVREGPGLRISWSEAGANYVYTLEATEALNNATWAPVAGAEWPLATNQWSVPVTGANTMFFRVTAEPQVSSNGFLGEGASTPAAGH